MNILTQAAFTVDVSLYIDDRSPEDFFTRAARVPWGELQDRIEWPPYVNIERDWLAEAHNDPALSQLLSRCFLAVVSRPQWDRRTAVVLPFDLESLERHEIFLRVRSAGGNALFLIPDDGLETPSIMLQVMVMPERVGVLKFVSGGAGIKWTAVVTGPCDGVTGDCDPGPGGCCGWREGQDGAGQGWVCSC